MDRRNFIKSIVGLGLFVGIGNKIDAVEKEDLQVSSPNLTKNREYVEIVFSNNNTCITVPRLANLSTYQRLNTWFGMDVDGEQIIAIPAILFTMYGSFNLALSLNTNNRHRAYIVEEKANA